ncbi:MAG TPA: cupredoxin domain-containing protein [Candidatus Nanoarchaeia archaeon]|nr:cupredoxin domain-containing protein [Candidatus Nanoarchaeia archaeon]
MKKATIYLGILIGILLIAGCTQKSAETTNGGPGNQQNDNIDFGNFKPGVEMINGVQVASLSWGKFNYEPAVIKLKAGIPTKLVIDPERLQGCFRSITIPELGVQKSFSDTDTVLEFTPTEKGSFPFGCTMGMGGGTLVIE